MLQRIVNAHSQIAIMPESHWIPRLFDKRKGLTPEGLVTPELIPHLLAQPEFGGLHIDQGKLEALLATHQQSLYTDFVAGIFDQYGKTQGKALVGNQTPGFVRRLRTLHTLWPKARFVHLIRDGRDVFLSTLHRTLKHPKPGVFDTWKDDPATTAALWWELNVRSGRQCGNSLGPELYYEIRYESLIAKPEQECRSLCDFLGLSFHDAMLRHQDTRPGFGAKVSAERDWQPITRGMRDWRSEMTPEQVERFAVGDLLDELGYPHAVPRSANRNLEDASKTRSVLMAYPDWSRVGNSSPGRDGRWH
jgi:hypothetical protein